MATKHSQTEGWPGRHPPLPVAERKSLPSHMAAPAQARYLPAVAAPGPKPTCRKHADAASRRTTIGQRAVESREVHINLTGCTCSFSCMYM